MKTAIISILVLGLVGPAVAKAPRVDAEYDLKVALNETSSVGVLEGPDGLAVFVWNTFEAEPQPATVVVLRDGDKPFRRDGVWSAALDEKWRRLAVGEAVTVVDATVSPPFSRADRVSRDLNWDAASLEDALYYDGFIGNGYITRPVIYELPRGERKPQAVPGGDFVDWAGGNSLIIGRENGRVKTPGTSVLALYGFTVGKKDLTLLADVGEATAKLGTKLSADIRYSPYLPSPWRLVSGLAPDAGMLASDVAAPSRGGTFENLGPAFAWRDEGGERADIANGNAVAVSGDGTWLLVVGDRGARRGFYALRLTWP